MPMQRIRMPWRRLRMDWSRKPGRFPSRIPDRFLQRTPNRTSDRANDPDTGQGATSGSGGGFSENLLQQQFVAPPLGRAAPFAFAAADDIARTAEQRPAGRIVRTDTAPQLMQSQYLAGVCVE